MVGSEYEDAPTEYSDNLIKCPYCKHKYHDPECSHVDNNEDIGEEECPKCEKEFGVVGRIKHSFESYKKKEQHGEVKKLNGPESENLSNSFSASPPLLPKNGLTFVCDESQNDRFTHEHFEKQKSEKKTYTIIVGDVKEEWDTSLVVTKDILWQAGISPPNGLVVEALDGHNGNCVQEFAPDDLINLDNENRKFFRIIPGGGGYSSNDKTIIVNTKPMIVTQDK